MRQWALLLIASSLAVIGLIMLKSIAPDLVGRQVLSIGLASGLVFWLTQFKFDQLCKLSWLGYWLLVIVLGLVLVLGDQTRGTVGWFSLGGGFKFQPSQFTIPTVSLFLLSRFNPENLPKNWQTWAKLAGLWLLPAVLIGLEPDFGSMMVYLVSTGGLLILYRLNWRIWLSLIGLSLVAGLIAWFGIFQAYQRDRILSFINPSRLETATAATETSAEYNSRQALIAVGSGGIFGRGLGYGVQSHLRFLPEHQTDFIFAALAEELGLIGSLFVVLVYALLIGLLWWLAFQQSSLTQTGYLLSMVLWFFSQTAINIGMNIGLLPITGITLPFLSYGGSSILGFALGLGITQVIGNETKKRMVIQIR